MTFLIPVSLVMSPESPVVSGTWARLDHGWMSARLTLSIVRRGAGQKPLSPRAVA
jgi:hypothetical protein